MTKQEFIQEAALRLIGARPSEPMCEIHRLAKNLADLIYPDDEEVSSDPVRPIPTRSDLPKDDISYLLQEAYRVEHQMAREYERKFKERHGYFPFKREGIAARIQKRFIVERISTVGDLLERGRTGILKTPGFGKKSIELIDQALLNLYCIETW